jgi:type I restriction enzyme R subunit
MASSKYPDALSSPEKTSVVREGDIEDAFIEKLRSLKYTHRPDIHDRASLERNFREKFEARNRVRRMKDRSFRNLTLP